MSAIGIPGVLIRGPLAQGIVCGVYTRDSVFTDSVRKNYNVGGIYRKKFEERIDLIDKVKAVYGTEPMAELALRYVISHESEPIAIPGATSVSQVLQNARVGEKLLDQETVERIREILRSE